MTRQVSGLKAWALQRVTAIYIGVFALYLLFELLFNKPPSYQAWLAWFADPIMGIATLVFIVSILLHAWVGVRDVIIDYIKPIAIRTSLLALIALSLLACGLWASQSLILVRLI